MPSSSVYATGDCESKINVTHIAKLPHGIYVRDEGMDKLELQEEMHLLCIVHHLKKRPID